MPIAVAVVGLGAGCRSVFALDAESESSEPSPHDPWPELCLEPCPCLIASTSFGSECSERESPLISLNALYGAGLPIVGTFCVLLMKALLDDSEVV
jgi:hypothetical protein